MMEIWSPINVVDGGWEKRIPFVDILNMVRSSRLRVSSVDLVIMIIIMVIFSVGGTKNTS